jgi:hypothetical protein
VSIARWLLRNQKDNISHNGPKRISKFKSTNSNDLTHEFVHEFTKKGNHNMGDHHLLKG